MQETRNKPFPSHIRKVATALLASVSMAAFLLSMSGPSIAATGKVVDMTIKGDDGSDGDGGFVTTGSTPGKNAGSISWTQTYAILSNTIRLGSADAYVPAVNVSSIGGAGGSVYSKGVFANEQGKRGGDAGEVTLNVSRNADISGTVSYFESTQYYQRTIGNPIPLIKAVSKGGTGGIGYTSYWSSDNYTGIGRGGDAKRVYFSLESNVTAVAGANPKNYIMPAILVSSEGGTAGVSKIDGKPSADGTFENRVDSDRGGHGGPVVADLKANSSVTTYGNYAPAISVRSVGGNGGVASNSGGYPSNGGIGDKAEFYNSGRIDTYGTNSAAVIVQSVGGSGGHGANGAFTSGTPGARGGKSGEVIANNYGTISTKGEYSFGIVAQSVGGIGGNGGGAAFTGGGDGGGAGLGGEVTVKNYNVIQTQGKGASGIVAQSIGGGNATDAFRSSSPIINAGGGGAGGNSGILPFVSGGTGGTGGVAKRVTAVNNGDVITNGTNAYGVLLQSIGGGGGTGGVGASTGAFLAVSLGGAGGGGGIGGKVNYESSQYSTIETFGKYSTALLAQSIGGGGGAGGYAAGKSAGYGLSISSAVGGSGGKGGYSDLVTINSSSAITTWGASARGIQASSIGGGGGVGGDANAFAVAIPAITPSGKPLPSIVVTNAVGGSGGDGGKGGQVNLTNHGAINTYGADATAIQAQSIGGGGGNAGNALAYGLAIAAPSATAFNVTNAIGGSGGGGGNADRIDLDNTGRIATYGDSSIGIQLQSIGGGGGNGGSASSTANAMSLYRTIEIGQTIGGSNPKGGGNGGFISAIHGGSIHTEGRSSAGIQAQSIGGGGGNGGDVNVSASSGLSFDKTLNSLVQKLPLADAVTITNAIGGKGGKGGDGDTVAVLTSENSTIYTYGMQSAGILAQSIGGGGGNGGGGSAASEGTLALSLSIGGSGGTGGKGKTVDISHYGYIETHGAASNGIMAQSIGGGGGNGGNLTAAKDDMPDTVGQIWSTLKEAVGIDAYNAWAKDKKNADKKKMLDEFIKDIQDSGAYKSLADAFKKSDFYKEMQSFKKKASDYLDKQSKGAVKRPDVSLKLAMGGDGGAGNVGGTVKVVSSGPIITTADFSHGIFAQSVGGGGGQGGVAYANGTNKTNINGTLGGKGGEGNVGGSVTVTNSGTIKTAGEISYGVFAQSVGGGGGVGVGANSSDNKNLVVNLTIGGNGGKGGAGGDVTVTNSGVIETKGNESHAIFAQSTGGGGGSFIMRPEAKKDDKKSDDSSEAKKTGDAEAVSEDTIAELLKALGIEKLPSPDDKDTKNPDKSGGFTIGGDGGASGKGGVVTINHSGRVQTAGEASIGIFAQSVGGGGGVSNAANSIGGVKYSASYGGKGGAAGEGGVINLNLQKNSEVFTNGDNSIGVFAQSIGGGGGYGGASVVQNWTLPVLGGDAGASGKGGDITLTFSDGAKVLTGGNSAHGVFLQSIGGGGGYDSSGTEKNLSATSGNFIRDGIAVGDGGNIKVSMAEPVSKFSITTAGEYAHGLYVQTIGGGGGAISDQQKIAQKFFGGSTRNNASGHGGNVEIDSNGLIYVTGKGSRALFVQSGTQKTDGSLDASRHGGDMTIKLGGELAQIGSAGGADSAAIWVDGGRVNKIEIKPGAFISADSGYAVKTTFADNYLTNHGTIRGAVSMTSNSSNFTNAVDGVYQAGSGGQVSVGSYFVNEGAVFVSENRPSRLYVEGDYKQTATGVLNVNVDSLLPSSENASLLEVTKNISLDGTIATNAVGGLRPEDFRVVKANGSLNMDSSAPLQVRSAGDGSPFNWDWRRGGTSSNEIYVTPHANFVTPTGLVSSPTEQNIMASLQETWNSGKITDDQAMLFAALSRSSSNNAYLSGIGSLSPEESLSSAVEKTLGARDSLHAALSCPVFEGKGVLLHENNCAWARLSGTNITRTGSGDAAGYTQDSISYKIGAQQEIASNWYAGGSFGYSTSTLHDPDGYSTTKGHVFDLSASLKHQIDSWLLSASAHVGYGSYNTDRKFHLGNLIDHATSSKSVFTAATRLRASYEMAYDSWYLRPYVDVDFYYTYMPSHKEDGRVLALGFASQQQFNASISPNIELGGRIDLSPETWLRPYATIGGTFYAKDRMSFDVTLHSGDGDVAKFTTETKLPNQVLNIGIGAQMFAQDKYELRAEYKANIAADYLSQEFGARFAIHF